MFGNDCKYPRDVYRYVANGQFLLLGVFNDLFLFFLHRQGSALYSSFLLLLVKYAPCAETDKQGRTSFETFFIFWTLIAFGIVWSRWTVSPSRHSVFSQFPGCFFKIFRAGIGLIG